MWELAHEHARTSPTDLVAMWKDGRLAPEAVAAILQMRGLDPELFGLRGTARTPFLPRNEMASYRSLGDLSDPAEYGSPTFQYPIGNSEEFGRIAQRAGGFEYLRHPRWVDTTPINTFNPDAQLDPSQVEIRFPPVPRRINPYKAPESVRFVQ